MPHFPYLNSKVRAPRVRAQGERVVICADGNKITGKLHTFSPTGGLVQVDASVQDVLAEIEMSTLYGTIRGLVQILPPQKDPRWRAFSFVALGDESHARLCTALAAMRADVPQPSARRGA